MEGMHSVCAKNYENWLKEFRVNKGLQRKNWPTPLGSLALRIAYSNIVGDIVSIVDSARTRNLGVQRPIVK